MVVWRDLKQYAKWPRGTAPFLRRAGLPDGSPTVVLLELLTWWFAEKDNLLFGSVDSLIDATGYPRRTVQRALELIRDSGLLIPAGGGVRNLSNQWRVSPGLAAHLNG